MPNVYRINCYAQSDTSKGFWTRGRFWPIGEHVVEVLDQDDDDPVDRTKIGRRTLQEVREWSVSKIVQTQNPRQPHEVHPPKFAVIEGGQLPEPVLSDEQKSRILEERVYELEAMLKHVMSSVPADTSKGAGKSGK